MNNTNNFRGGINSPKVHYPILDGLRGVAALMVLVFHIFEMYSLREVPIQHGYLAVDFFFLLSGFVIAHAYDNRWGSLTPKEFFKRRLIRLHPMIIFGMTFGAILYYFSASDSLYPNIPDTPVIYVIGILILSYFLIPSLPSMDIRTFGEMYPLNGPSWTLFFEYIANILYVYVFRKFSTRVLTLVVVVAAIVLAIFAITNGNVIGGWQFSPVEVGRGLTRLIYPFLAGMLLKRFFKPMKFDSSFFWCSVLLIAIMMTPVIGNENQAWMNGLFEASAIIFIFPLIIFMGASGKLKTNTSKKVCNFLGEISYPLYIIHYPIMYIYYGWIMDHEMSIESTYGYAVGLFFLCIGIAYLSVRLYDRPVRKKLQKLFLKK